MKFSESKMQFCKNIGNSSNIWPYVSQRKENFTYQEKTWHFLLKMQLLKVVRMGSMSEQVFEGRCLRKMKENLYKQTLDFTKA